MATHQYTRTSGGLTVLAGTEHVFTTAAFSVPTGEQFVRMKVIDPNTSTTNIQLRGDAQTVFGGAKAYDVWKSSVSAIWTDGNGVKIKVVNSGSARVSMRISVVIETEDIPKYSITCNSSGNGTLTASRTEAREGQLVTLTATPASGYVLSHYTTSPALTIGSNNKFTMPGSNVTVTAVFTNQKYTVTVNSEDTAKGTVTGSGSYAYGSSVTISATPKPGYKFVNWTTTKGTIANPNAASTTFTVPNGNATITAHFERSQSIVKVYDENTFKNCYVAVYNNGEWKDCDVLEYVDGQWKLCSHT